MSRSGTLGRAFGQVPEPGVEVHPQELARRGWDEGALVHVTSRRGTILLPVRASDAVPLAQAFIAMHWGEEFVSGRACAGARLAGVNALMSSVVCAQSKQPELKHAAVKLLKAELPWHLMAAAWLPEAQALTAQQDLRALFPAFAYAHCVPFGRESGEARKGPSHGRLGVLLRAAAQEPASDELMVRIEATLGLTGAQVLRYADAKRGQRRAMRLGTGSDPGGAALDAFVLAGQTAAAAWVLDLLQEGLPARQFGQALLNGRASPPTAVPPRAPQVCNCLDVSQRTIIDRLAGCRGNADERLAQLQQALGCGTQCGSCLPAVRALVAQHVARSLEQAA